MISKGPEYNSCGPVTKPPRSALKTIWDSQLHPLNRNISAKSNETMKAWQQKESAGVWLLAWRLRVSVSSPASPLLLYVQPINCTMKQDKWELPTRQRLMSFEPICTHSINKRRRSNSLEHLYWRSGPERLCVCDEVRYLKLAKASVAVCLWLEMYEGIGFKPLLLFPPSLPPSMSSSNEQRQPTIVTSVLQKSPTDYMSITTKSPESW